VFGVSLGWANYAFTVKNISVFGVRQIVCNTEHSTFLKKSGTSDGNTKLVGIAIRSAIICRDFCAKKLVKFHLEVFFT
jgi:hypothetical protein